METTVPLEQLPKLQLSLGTPRRPLPRHSPRLSHAGSKLVAASSAAHSRFVRVPGGWRPRGLATLPESVDIGAGHGHSPTYVNTEAPWHLQNVSIHHNPSQSSLTSTASRSWASTSQFSITKGWSQHKRSQNKASKATYAYRLWPAKFISCNVTRSDGIARLAEGSKEGSDDEASPDKPSPAGGGQTNSRDGLHRLESSRFDSGGGRRNSREGLGRWDGVRVSVFGRRRSSASSPRQIDLQPLSPGSDLADSFGTFGPVHHRGTPDAVGLAKTAVQQALLDGCTKSETRSRRLLAYAEALLASPEVKHREQERHDIGSLNIEEAEEDLADLETCQHNQESGLAAFFAEYDGGLTGFILQHDVRSLLRRAGRALSAEEVSQILESLPDWDDMDDEIDLKDLLSICDIRRNAERVYLHSNFRDKFNGTGGAGIRPDLRDLTKVFEGINIHITPEQVRRTAAEMKLSIFGNHVAIPRETQLFILAEKCTELEKQRAHERAGFSFDQVQRFEQFFEATVGLRRGARFEELIIIMESFDILVSDIAEKTDLHQIFLSGQGKGTELSIWECLHAARRFLDKKEMDERDRDARAAMDAGIPHFELRDFRAFYDQLIEEDKADVFSYKALCNAVRIMGATLSMETNAELDSLFRHYASPTIRDQEEVDHLYFSDFISLIANLFSEDFGGIKTGFNAGVDGDEAAVAFLQQSETRRMARRTGLVRS